MVRSEGIDLADRLTQLVDELPDAVMLLNADLRIQLAVGKPFRAYGYDPRALVGRLVFDVLPPGAYEELREPYARALDGERVEIDYVSAASGGTFRVRMLPTRGADGSCDGMLTVTTDMSELTDLKFQVGEAQGLLHMGSAVFTRRSGWVADDALREVFGIGQFSQPKDVIDSVIVPEDRQRVANYFRGLMTTGGRGEGIVYRIEHGISHEIRQIHGSTVVNVDGDGALIAARTVQLDITEMARGQVQLAQMRQRAAEERLDLLDELTQILANPMITARELLHSTATLIARATQGRCAVRTFNLAGYLTDVSALSDQLVVERGTTSVADEWGEWIKSGPRTVASLPAFMRRAVVTGKAVWGASYERAPDEPSVFAGVRFLAVPIRAGARVIGVVTVARPAGEPEYHPSEVRHVQVLADWLGTRVDADRSAIHAATESSARIAAEELVRVISADQRDIVTQLDATEARERIRLAEIVHDDPLQLVVAAMLGLDSVAATVDPPAAARIESALILLESAVGNLRSVISTLTPPDLTGGLGPALALLSRSLFSGSTTEINVNGPDHVSLDPATKESVYRIVREALINARKHAHASEVDVTLRESADRVDITVTDNGVGMGAADAGAGHLGFPSMRARAAAAGATLDVASNHPTGTQITVSLPALHHMMPPDGT